MGTFRGPSNDNLSCLVAQAITGEGAAALIIGADPDMSVERPLFQILSASQTIIPDSNDGIKGHLREGSNCSLFKECARVDLSKYWKVLG